ncbi:MAG: lipopolysaccharide biosynthesis protein RfbH [Candidatus Nanoarchaeia archaeon]|nr:lipopolysaccharide biosynthesis protein RfbH [Candidatus Nanoarchaeia archaeon]MDD5239270.1 lipopolysaccharide biosynthesis protein RfbH [Candidatus Nanoarchaeia archaeon]
MDHKDKLKKEIFEKVKEYYKSYLSKKPEGVPVSGKKFDEKEVISIVDAALDGWWTEGRVTEAFEKKLNAFLGTKHTLVVNSGSSANLLAFAALTSAKLKERRIKPGDEVITVAAGFPTTINPIILYGCVPVFCDVDLETYNINIEQFKKAISPKTKAVFLAHTLGNPFNLEEIKKACQKHNLWLIEDACDALGAKYKGKPVGTFGDIATFSFYPAHQITMGEGGAIVTDNALLARILKSLKDWGRDCFCKTGQDNACGKRFSWQLGNLPYGYDHKYTYSEMGYNLKNTDLNVAIGLAQMDKLDDFVKARKRNFEMLSQKMKKYSDYFMLPKPTKDSEPSWFGFLMTLTDKCRFTRRDLLEYLDKNRIGTRLLFGGNITKQPYFVDNNIKYRVVGDFTNSNRIMNDSFWIGVCPAISEKDIDYVIAKIGAFIREH